MLAYADHFQQKIIAIRADCRYEFELLQAPDCSLDCRFAFAVGQAVRG